MYKTCIDDTSRLVNVNGVLLHAVQKFLARRHVPLHTYTIATKDYPLLSSRQLRPKDLVPPTCLLSKGQLQDDALTATHRQQHQIRPNAHFVSRWTALFSRRRCLSLPTPCIHAMPCLSAEIFFSASTSMNAKQPFRVKNLAKVALQLPDITNSNLVGLRQDLHRTSQSLENQ